MKTSWTWTRTQELRVSQRFTSKHYQHCADEVGKPNGIQMELAQLQPHFSPMSSRRQANTDATRTLSPGGIALTQSVRER